MKSFKKVISLIVLVLLLAPSFVQLAHVFEDEHEEHVVCTSNKEQHFHEYELDCDICTFHFYSFLTVDLPSVIFTKAQQATTICSLYNSLISNTILSFTLRGPPSLV